MYLHKEVKLAAKNDIETVLCLSVLVAAEILPASANLEDARIYYQQVGYCEECPMVEKCLACIMNE